MSIRVAINGYGRIGRCLLRFIYEYFLNENLFKIVFINDLSIPSSMVYLTKYDTTHGNFGFDVSLKSDDIMIIGNDKIKLLHESNPCKLPCEYFKVDLLFECTGIFTSKKKCYYHLQSGVKKILISAPSNNHDVDATIVYGINHSILHDDMNVISGSSCSTNCLAPIVKILHQNFIITSGLMTTIHSYTNDQSLVDSYHEDFRRARAASYNMIPTKTGAASTVGLIIPDLQGKLDGFAIRVPTINVSVIDFSCTISCDTASVNDINNIMKLASKKELQGVLGYNEDLLVSSDFNHNYLPSIFDSTQTRVIGNLVKVLSWYDNEWGFVNQMLKIASFWLKL